MEEPAQRAFSGDGVNLAAEDYVEDPGLLVRGDRETPSLRNHGKIDVNRLNVETKQNLMLLMYDFSMEPGILKAQVTFDFEPDQPPTVHVITESTKEAIDRWLT